MYIKIMYKKSTQPVTILCGIWFNIVELKKSRRNVVNYKLQLFCKIIHKGQNQKSKMVLLVGYSNLTI